MTNVAIHRTPLLRERDGEREREDEEEGERDITTKEIGDEKRLEIV